MKSPVAIIAPVLFIILVPTDPALAITWHVLPDGSGDAPTIQAAIDLSAPDDTILAAPGTYFENITMRSRRTLTSEMGAAVTTLDGGVGGSVIRCINITNPTLIAGFTIQNGRTEYGGGLHCSNSALTVARNIFRYNETYGGGYGGAIYATQCPPEMVFRNNLIYGNYAYIGGGICCNGNDRSTVEGNTIVNNDCYHAGGIISYNSSSITISKNIIALNDGPSGYGIYIHSSSSAMIDCNDVWQNTPANYHGTDMTGVDGNISVDPLFCDVQSDNYSLGDSSPCLPGHHPDGANCGLIGALDVGCQGPTPVRELSWGAIKATFR